MVYSFNILTPKNTTKATPLVTNLKVEYGIIHHWEICFPEGNNLTTRMIVKHGSDYLIPSNQDGELLGSGATIGADDFIFMLTPPHEISIHSWNTSSLFDHSIYGYFFMLPPWRFNVLSPVFQRLEEDNLEKGLSVL